jgi:hypothetical protein
VPQAPATPSFYSPNNPEYQTPVVQEPEIPLTPATPAAAPELAWSIDPTNIELDDEKSMGWNEQKTETAPISAATEQALPEFLTTKPVVEPERKPSRAEVREAKRQAKLELKAQRKAAKDSRHSED